MSPLLWLALLLGWLLGAGAAMALLPPQVVSPLYGTLAVATVVVIACVVVGLIRHYRRVERSPASSPPIDPGPPQGGRRADPPTASEPPDRLEHGRPAEPRGAARAEGAVPWPIGGTGEQAAALSADEVRQALLEQRVRIAMYPLEARPSGPAVFHRAAARLCDAGGRPFGPERYRPTLARCGLLGVMDRIVLAHAAQVLGRAGPGDQRLVCSLDSGGLTEAAVVAELEQLAVDAPEVLCRLILELQRGRLDRPSARLMGRLRVLGAGFCLHRLSLRGLADEGLVAQGFDYVRITADPEAGDDERALAAAAAAGLTVLWPGAEPAEMALPGGALPDVEDAAPSAA